MQELENETTFNKIKKYCKRNLVLTRIEASQTVTDVRVER